jgi:hypothetical protein
MSNYQGVRKFCCTACKAHLGDITSTGLVMGGGRFLKTVTMCCVKCSRVNKWHSATNRDSLASDLLVNHEEQVATIIQQSLSQNDERRFQAAKESCSPRRDPYIDAAEEEADNLFYESIANRERAKKRA